MPKTVFVIDDDENLQTVLEIALMEAGYAVERAGDGATALARLHTRTPDLVLCDVIMPYVDGAQVWQVLRERLQYAGVPFVLLTALDRKPWFAELEAEGVVVLHKPFNIDRLIAIIDSYLDDALNDS
jgi:DNA-binding response OmpR family regulator